jgi:hypothetical protein
MKKFAALFLAGALSVVSASAAADVAGGPPGSGGSGGDGGSGGAGGGDGGSGGKKSGGGCAASPETTSRSAAFALGLGLLFAVPAVRRRSQRRRAKP